MNIYNGEEIDFSKWKTQERTEGVYLVLETIYNGVVIQSKKIINIFPDQLDIWEERRKVETLKPFIYENRRNITTRNEQLRLFE